MENKDFPLAVEASLEHYLKSLKGIINEIYGEMAGVVTHEDLFSQSATACCQELSMQRCELRSYP